MDPLSDVRFFARAIWFVILCAFLWLLAFALSGGSSPSPSSACASMRSARCARNLRLLIGSFLTPNIVHRIRPHGYALLIDAVLLAAAAGMFLATQSQNCKQSRHASTTLRHNIFKNTRQFTPHNVGYPRWVSVPPLRSSAVLRRRPP